VPQPDSERRRDDYALAAVRLATAASVAGIGADVDDSDDAARARERIRAFARARLARPGPDAYLAEILAAESDY
jgi:hypothetical protein